jgi:hypothetical protein
MAATSAGASGMRIMAATLAGQAGPLRNRCFWWSMNANCPPSTVSTATVPCNETSASKRSRPPRSTSICTVPRTRSPPSQLVARVSTLMPRTAACRARTGLQQFLGAGRG